jgi:hypothetical protein
MRVNFSLAKRKNRRTIMDLISGFIGFSSFFLSLLTIGLLGYWQSDRLEAWVKGKISKSRQK